MDPEGQVQREGWAEQAWTCEGTRFPKEELQAAQAGWSLGGCHVAGESDGGSHTLWVQHGVLYSHPLLESPRWGAATVENSMGFPSKIKNR